MVEFEFKCEKIPSINNTYKQNKSGEVFKIANVKQYQRDLALYAFCFEKQNAELFTQKIQVELEFKVQNLNRDIDNMAKATLDALQGICYKNDMQIYKLTMAKSKSQDSLEYVRVKILEFH